MKDFAWSPEKNEWLKGERGVSFEEIVFHILRGEVLDLVDHPNQAAYPGQRMWVVEVDDYAYLVPFVESDSEVFLKTVIPSRRATKQYLGEKT